MYIDTTQIVIIAIVVVILLRTFRYISNRIANWITTAVVVLIILAVINPYQTKIMVHNLWLFLLHAFHNIQYVVS